MRTSHSRALSLIPVLLLALQLTGVARAAHREAARGTGGAVASEDPTATAAGLETLRAGGNAVDAAVATALALAVVHPEAGNLGGGGFAVLRLGDVVETLDFRETAPAAATAGMYLDEEGEPVPEASRVGPLAAGVPGTPRGLWELHQRHGRLPWADVVEPARRAAAEGFPIAMRLHRVIEQKRDLLALFDSTAEVWLPEGEVPAAGRTMRIPALAATLADYAKHGPAAIVEGERAAAIERAVAERGGILTASDLAAYRPVWREPVRSSAWGWEIVGMDLPSSGGILVAGTLRMLELLGWDRQPRFGAIRAHLLAETWRRLYADRFLLGDPSSTFATAANLLDPEWLERRAREVDLGSATPSGLVRTWPAGAVTEPSDTTHLAVIDAAGGVVSLTTTLNGSFGCGLLVPKTGFLLNNEMDDFAAAPGRPNLYGLIQSEANAVGAGRRMLSSMAPTIAWREGEVVAAGGRGGSRIPTATAQVLLALMVDGDDLQAAVSRPRIHHQWLPDVLYAEPDALSPETRAELERRGHQVVVWDGFTTPAKVQAVRRLVSGEVEAAGDPRSRGVGGVVDEIR